LTLRTLLLVLAMAAAPAALAQTPVAPRATCDALAGVDLSAELGVPARVEAAAVQAEGRPAPVCHLRGTIRGTIGFEAWLPLERWTGRYLQVGCGGLCGRVPSGPPQAHGCVPSSAASSPWPPPTWATATPPPPPGAATRSGASTSRTAPSTSPRARRSC
jgi:hypothetical protein